ncbi:MAG: hypothetical protein V7731_16950 [Amphritea sp.]
MYRMYGMLQGAMDGDAAMYMDLLILRAQGCAGAGFISAQR